MHKLRATARWMWLLALGLTAGCAEIRPWILPTERPAESAWDAHRASIQVLDAWTIQGRVAVQTETQDNSATEGGTATVHWVEEPGHYQLRIIAPFNQGTYVLDGDSEGVRLRAPDGTVHEAIDADALLEERLGWRLPVSGLRYWIRGIPDPHEEYDSLQLDEQGRITDVQQAGWRVSVLRYATVGSVDLPDKLYMASDRVKLRIAVQSWDVPG